MPLPPARPSTLAWRGGSWFFFFLAHRVIFRRRDSKHVPSNYCFARREVSPRASYTAVMRCHGHATNV
ncbi:hypothetical protein N657DRAFT_641977 [Parathielavia appendiculata]|uniref:Uncharacterized protein n=1 Tax=Parathielavia appendiculata TaxID=2587402 RepID=A0AAN6Z6V5_9PEZI|nr:hypothetical protein N657DRAFT_641977 [Parathielavia appendiculata]